MTTKASSCLIAGLAGSLLLVSAASCGKSESKEASTKPAAAKVEPLPDSAYRAELTVSATPPSGPAGTKTTVTVTVKNTGDTAWPANGKVGNGLVHLGSHWLDPNGKPVVFEGGRTPFPTPLQPGASATLQAKVEYPKDPGEYILEFDMVHEGVAWFAWKKSPTARVVVKVT